MIFFLMFLKYLKYIFYAHQCSIFFFDKNSKINYIVITIENNCFLF